MSNPYPVPGFIRGERAFLCSACSAEWGECGCRPLLKTDEEISRDSMRRLAAQHLREINQRFGAKV